MSNKTTETAERTFDVLHMGRSCIDLYSNDIGAPFEEIKTFAAYVGGSPTNMCVGGARLGLENVLLTAVGDDPVGEFVLHFLKNENVETRYIPRKPGKRTSCVLLGIQPPDAFGAGFLYGYVKNWGLYQAARLGNACGAIVVTRHGCSISMPTYQEVMEFVDSRGGLELLKE
jgi:sugar/nucleoside kinase (ribokinase family)